MKYGREQRGTISGHLCCSTQTKTSALIPQTHAIPLILEPQAVGSLMVRWSISALIGPESTVVIRVSLGVFKTRKRQCFYWETGWRTNLRPLTGSHSARPKKYFYFFLEWKWKLQPTDIFPSRLTSILSCPVRWTTLRTLGYRLNLEADR